MEYIATTSDEVVARSNNETDVLAAVTKYIDTNGGEVEDFEVLEICSQIPLRIVVTRARQVAAAAPASLVVPRTAEHEFFVGDRIRRISDGAGAVVVTPDEAATSECWLPNTTPDVSMIQYRLDRASSGRHYFEADSKELTPAE